MELVINSGADVVSTEITNELATVGDKIAEFETQLKKIKEQEDALKAKILEEMEKHNVLKLETDSVRINYIASSDTEYFDKTTFKKENPDLYDNYVSMRQKKAFVKITVK